MHFFMHIISPNRSRSQQQ